LQNTHAYYYEPSQMPADGGEISILLILVIIAFVAAIVWLVNWAPDSSKDGKDKTLLEEIDGIFEDLRDQAAQFNRGEVATVLGTAQDQVTRTLARRGLIRRP
jgi:hypothetical protein